MHPAASALHLHVVQVEKMKADSAEPHDLKQAVSATGLVQIPSPAFTKACEKIIWHPIPNVLNYHPQAGTHPQVTNHALVHKCKSSFYSSRCELSTANTKFSNHLPSQWGYWAPPNYIRMGRDAFGSATHRHQALNLTPPQSAPPAEVLPKKKRFCPFL